MLIYVLIGDKICELNTIFCKIVVERRKREKYSDIELP